MTVLRAELEQFLNGQMDIESLLQSFRPYYHSLNPAHREDVVDLLVELPEAEASRELLLLYRLSLWRSTRFRIVRALARVPSPRALEFLMRLAADESDLSLCEEAVWALGRSRRTLAARFLTHLYQECSETLKPKVVAAIGEAGDGTMLDVFWKTLAEIPDATHSLLARNIALAMAELRDARVQPWLENAMQNQDEVHLLQGFLLAYGKCSREAKFLDGMERVFQRDMMLWSVAQNVRTHVLFRNQWKLEDYLQKIFEATNVHPMLPRELNGFALADVKEGLKLFLEQKYVGRMAFALGGVFSPEIGSWYEEFFDVESLSEEDFVCVMDSVSRHQHGSLKAFLEKAGTRVRRNDFSVVAFEAWAHAVALSLPRAEEVLNEWFAEDVFAGLVESRQISLINAFVSYVLVVQKDAKKRKSAFKILDKVLAVAKSQAVVARTLRAFGQLEEVGNKTHDVLRRVSTQEELLPSCLFLIEKAPSKQSCEVLNEIMGAQPAPDSRRRMAFLKAAATQPEVNSLVGYEAFVEKCACDADARVATEALLCIAAHPRAGFVKAVKTALSNDSLRLPATVAAKALQSEDLVDSLGECLKVGSESVVGRAIDALVSLPGARAKRMVLDYWCQNPTEYDLCDKIIRTLEAPPRAGEFFAQKVATVLEAHPNHSQREGLVAMRERFLNERVATHAAELTPVELQKIDKEIAMHIPGYHRFEEDVKASLRAAEVPFYRPEMFRGAVDKSSSVIAWCKAIDLVLERHIGRKVLFPKIDKTLAEFQNVLHIVGLDDPHISYTRLRQTLRLENVFSDENFPGHKMVLVAQGFLSGRIVQDQWRILDGLRAWAVLILIFSRGAHLPGGKPLINLGAVAPADLEKLAKRLIALQDLRNPVAHRETWLRFPQIDEVRNEVSAVFRDWENIVG